MTQPLYLIPEPVLQKAIDYLGTRPYSEVAGIIAAIQTSIESYTEPKHEEPIKEKKA